MHLHMSLANPAGQNLFADTKEGHLSDLMLKSIGGVRKTVGDSMLNLAPFMNSWRRFAATVYSPASDTWGIDNRTVAIRVPSTPGAARHFENRVAGVDANPYLVAAVTLAGALEGIATGEDPGPPVEGDDSRARGGGRLPRGWLDAIDRLDASAFAKTVLGPRLHQAFVAVKRA